MVYDFKRFETRTAEIDTWLGREFSGIRTGRATPVLLDFVQVEAYGAKVPINQVGSVNVEDARTLRVSVWDASLVRAVEKGIIDADLGMSVVSDSSGLRVIFPELTGERRIQLLKIAKAKLEEAMHLRKVAISVRMRNLVQKKTFNAELIYETTHSKGITNLRRKK
jgi:ribosome recycling factor